MNKRFKRRQTDPGTWIRTLTFLFGAMPVTVACGLAVLAFVGGLYGLFAGEIFAILFALIGAAGIYGTYSLWMIALGYWSRAIAWGLGVGIAAASPMLFFFAFPGRFSAWSIVVILPVLTAIVFLTNTPKAHLSAPTTRAAHIRGSIGVLVSPLYPLAVFALPLWATPIAKFWYGRGFEDAVAEALERIPDNDNVCLFDDTRYMFVHSIEQLDVDRMIEAAVNDNSPIPNTHLRDPHFRVYNGRTTFYWSFRNRRFYAFSGARFSLADTTDQLCGSYRRSPTTMIDAFEQRNDVPVDERNFCCSIDRTPN